MRTLRTRLNIGHRLQGVPRRRVWLSAAANLAACLVAPTVAQATWPGANGAIAFVRGHDIYLINVDGTGFRQLTRGPDFDRDPAWSPDGTELLFSRRPGGDAPTTSRLMRMRPFAPGTPVETVPTFTDEDTYAPTYSRDAQQIVYARTGQNPMFTDLWIARRDGTDARRITRSGFDSELSPAGPVQLVFSTGSDNGDVELVNLDGTGRRRFPGANAAPGMSLEHSPNWSPDGRAVVLGRWVYDESTPEGDVDTDLIVANVSGRTRTLRVDESAETFWTGVWSPDSRQIAYTEAGTIWVVPQSGGPGTRVSRMGAGAEDLAWQPIVSTTPPPPPAPGGDPGTDPGSPPSPPPDPNSPTGPGRPVVTVPGLVPTPSLRPAPVPPGPVVPVAMPASVAVPPAPTLRLERRAARRVGGCRIELRVKVRSVAGATAPSRLQVLAPTLRAARSRVVRTVRVGASGATVRVVLPASVAPPRRVVRLQLVVRLATVDAVAARAVVRVPPCIRR
ncbi:MAG TPA: hypothetical protein VNT51_12105 [Miltoncostaeaceae bacterium]|nr:hypothetical protein [Miltoncostaeaceae bacterium]